MIPVGKNQTYYGRTWREFKREERKCEEVVNFEWKELGSIKSRLSETLDELKEEMIKNKDNFDKNITDSTK